MMADVGEVVVLAKEVELPIEVGKNMSVVDDIAGRSQ